MPRRSRRRSRRSKRSKASSKRRRTYRSIGSIDDEYSKLITNVRGLRPGAQVTQSQIDETLFSVLKDNLTHIVRPYLEEDEKELWTARLRSNIDNTWRTIMKLAKIIHFVGENVRNIDERQVQLSIKVRRLLKSDEIRDALQKEVRDALSAYWQHRVEAFYTIDEAAEQASDAYFPPDLNLERFNAKLRKLTENFKAE